MKINLDDLGKEVYYVEGKDAPMVGKGDLVIINKRYQLNHFQSVIECVTYILNYNGSNHSHSSVFLTFEDAMREVESRLSNVKWKEVDEKS